MAHDPVPLAVLIATANSFNPRLKRSFSFLHGKPVPLGRATAGRAERGFIDRPRFGTSPLSDGKGLHPAPGADVNDVTLHVRPSVTLL